MLAKIFRRAIILLAVYSIVIIGIFVLQFKNDSIISEKLGTLHIVLLESAADDNSVSLKNKFTVSFNGITFSGNDEKSVRMMTGNSSRAVSLVSWEKTSPLSCILHFTQGVDIQFSVSDDTSLAFLNVRAKIPQNADFVVIPYSFSVGSAVTAISDSRIQVTNKKVSWELSASEIEDNMLVVSRKEPVASYVHIDKNRSFSFAMANGLDAASETAYINIIEDLKNNLISSFPQSLSDTSPLSEQEVVSYVAVMAEKGRYNEAVDAVPQSFKKSTSRTYLSAPFFNNLSVTSESLFRQMQSYSDMIQAAAETGTYDVFTVKNLADYMCMHPGSSAIHKLLQSTAESELEGITVLQASGILSVYADLYEKNSELAAMLSGAAGKCISKIENSCSFDDSRITIAEKGTLLSVINAAGAGDALLRYGKITGNADYAAGGRLILHSYLKDSASFDLRTLSELYPAVVHTNMYYPHYEIMAFDNGQAVWAWTCANNISYENDNAGAITLAIDFPLSYTHYVIISGIQQFKTIYIYNMAFRSDYRFETYNSSGYVYRQDRSTLLLKSRHRSEIETIRLIYTEKAAEQSDEIHEEEVGTGE